MHLCNINWKILLFFQFLIQIWKHVKFSTNTIFLNDREPVEPDWYTGPNRLNYGFWFEIWIHPVLEVYDWTDPVYRNRTAAIRADRSGEGGGAILTPPTPR
jgi:hypothetical protein